MFSYLHGMLILFVVHIFDCYCSDHWDNCKTYSNSTKSVAKVTTNSKYGPDVAHQSEDLTQDVVVPMAIAKSK